MRCTASRLAQMESRDGEVLVVLLTTVDGYTHDKFTAPCIITLLYPTMLDEHAVQF